MVERLKDREERKEIELASLDLEETKQSDDDESEVEVRSSPYQNLTRDSVRAYSRWLHKNAPPNYYNRVRVPWRTFLLAFIFLVVG